VSIKDLINILPIELILKVVEHKPNSVDWKYISQNISKLPEEFIEEYNDYIYWEYISENQPLSEEFIERHANKVNWEGIFKYQTLSKEFIEKHKDKINKNN